MASRARLVGLNHVALEVGDVEEARRTCGSLKPLPASIVPEAAPDPTH